MPRLNHRGGVIPESAALVKLAQRADLGTLPLSVQGTNCGNCLYIQPTDTEPFLYCNHPQVRQLVTGRMCCAFWDHPGYLRVK